MTTVFSFFFLLHLLVFFQRKSSSNRLPIQYLASGFEPTSTHSKNSNYDCLLENAWYHLFNCLNLSNQQKRNNWIVRCERVVFFDQLNLSEVNWSICQSWNNYLPTKRPQTHQLQFEQLNMSLIQDFFLIIVSQKLYAWYI